MMPVEIIIEGIQDVLPQIDAIKDSGYKFCDYLFGCSNYGTKLHNSHGKCHWDETKPLKCLSCPNCSEKARISLTELANASSVLFFKYRSEKTGVIDNDWITDIAYK